MVTMVAAIAMVGVMANTKILDERRGCVRNGRLVQNRKTRHRVEWKLVEDGVLGKFAWFVD